MIGCLAVFALLSLLGAQVGAVTLWAAGSWTWPLWLLPSPIVAAALLLVALSLLGAWRRKRDSRLAFERAVRSVRPFGFR